jgi:RNA polymerase sigma-70 factor, ECF subfamily
LGNPLFGQQEYSRALQPLLKPAGRYALSILRNRQDAEDAVQNAALRGLERLSGYDPDRPFKAWWFAILRNCCIDRIRQFRGVVHQPLNMDALANVPAEPDAALEKLELAMGYLPAPHREVIQLHYFAGLRYAEIAETLAIPVGTVMSRLFLARQSLAAKLEEEAG